MIRLLIVDGSKLMAWLVENLAPRGVLIEQACSFREAESILRHDPPDAAIFNITPCRLDWAMLGNLCRSRKPPVPFLCCSAVNEFTEEDDDLPCPPEEIIFKPFLIPAFRERIEDLLEQVGQRKTAGTR